jgi:hypothetical protein
MFMIISAASLSNPVIWHGRGILLAVVTKGSEGPLQSIPIDRGRQTERFAGMTWLNFCLPRSVIVAV